MWIRRYLLPMLLIALAINWGGGEALRNATGAAAVAQEATSLTHEGKTIQEWIADLADEEPYISEEAADALQEIGEPAVPALIEALASEDVRVRRSVAQILGKIGAVTPDIVPALIEALKDGDAEVRENAAQALARMGVPPEKPAEEEERPRGEALRKLWVLPEDKQLANLPRFGEELFVRAGVAAARPAPPAPVSPQYILGPGDELAIRCWGEALTHLDTTVVVLGPGNIYLALLGELPVAGQTLGAVRSLLAQRLREFYADSQVSVTVSAPRVVTIYVTGDVKRPGRYQLDGTATVLTALYAAGGPATSGSLRNIRWISGGETMQIDLYPYLLRGEPLAEQLLQTGDTIFVGPLGPEIGITGQVQRPARYELAESITCRVATELAGGLAPSAYAQRVQVWRVADYQQQTVINVNLQLPSSSGQVAGADFQLQAGDVLVVPSVLPLPENAARISGAVRRPGIYEVEAGMRLSDLLEKAQGLDEGAYLQQASIRRLDERKRPQHRSFSVEDVLEQEEDADLAVQPYDEVRIYYREEVTPITYVEVRGPVQNPDQYQWVERMTVRDLITEAGGVTEAAYLSQACLLRLQSDGHRQILKIRLAEALQGATEANMPLQAGDILEISTQEEAIPLRLVHIHGFVQRPHNYKYYEGMKVSDLIFVAGGLSPGAGHTIEYAHGRLEGLPEVQQLELVWEQEDQVTVLPDPVLKPADQVTVLGVGDFREQLDVAEVQGQVTRPGAYILHNSAERNETLYELLQRCGPLLADANPDGTVIYRLSERAVEPSQRENLNQIMRLYNRERAAVITGEQKELQQAAIGDQVARQAAQIFSETGATTVVLPPRPLSLANWMTGIPVEGRKLLATRGEKGDIPLRSGDTIVVPRLKSTVAVLGAVVRPGSVSYQRSARLINYVRKAGGLANDAAIKRAVVIRANSTVIPASQARLINPGDIILVPSDYLLRTIHTESGFERVLRALSGILGILLLTK